MNNRKFYQIHSKSFEKYQAKSDKDLWEAIKSKGFTGLSVDVKTTFKKSQSSNKFHAIFSSEREDRHGEIVYQNWDLKNFKKNPVYLDSHNYSSIDFIIGKVSPIKVNDKKQLVGDIEFTKANPRGAMAEEMAKDGFLNTSSVGFIPKKFDDKGNILESELLEISAVGVPANPEALYEKSYGKDITREDTENNKPEESEPVSDSEKERKENIEEKPKEEEQKIIKKETSLDLLKKAVQNEVDLRIKYLKQISEAIRLVREKTKGRNSSDKGDRTNINNEINKAVRNLLKMKI